VADQLGDLVLLAREQTLTLISACACSIAATWVKCTSTPAPAGFQQVLHRLVQRCVR